MPEKTTSVRTGVRNLGCTFENQRGSRSKRAIEYVMREAPKTPELDDMSRSVAPSIATYGPANKPRMGIWLASQAIGSPLCPATLCRGNMDRLKFEKASAYMSTVRMSAIDVRGTTLAGRIVSWLAWLIDSSPTNEIIASEAPYARWNGSGHAVTIWWMSNDGLKAKRKPMNRIDDSLMISSAPRISLNFDDSRTPRMFKKVSITTKNVASRIKMGCTPEKLIPSRLISTCVLSTGMKKLIYPADASAKSEMSMVKSSSPAQPATNPQKSPNPR